MQSYLFIGGAYDGQRYPVADDTDYVQLPGGFTATEVYTRESLSLGDTHIDIFRHESLTQARVLDRMVHYYVAWRMSSPSGNH